MDDRLRKTIQKTLDMTDEEFVEFEARASSVPPEAGRELHSDVTRLFSHKEEMLGMIVTMRILHPTVGQTLDLLKEVPDDTTTGSVSLAIMSNAILLLRLIGLQDADLLNIATRAIEVSSLFDQAMTKKGIDVFFKKERGTDHGRR